MTHVARLERDLANQKDNASMCLMQSYLQNENLDTKDAIGMAVDMILAGTDTVRKVP